MLAQPWGSFPRGPVRPDRRLLPFGSFTLFESAQRCGSHSSWLTGGNFFAFRAKLVISGDSGEIRCGEAEVGGSLKIFVFPVNSGQSRAFLVFPPLRGRMKSGRLRISAFLPNSDDHRQRGRYCAVSENPIDSHWDGSVVIVGAWRRWVLSLVRCVGPTCLRTNVLGLSFPMLRSVLARSKSPGVVSRRFCSGASGKPDPRIAGKRTAARLGVGRQRRSFGRW